MATPTEALNGLNKIKERYDFLKAEILRLLDEDEAIKNKINIYLQEIESMEETYVDLIGDLTPSNNA